MKTKKTLDHILLGDGVYVSAIPVLILSAVSDALDNLVGRLIKIFNHHKD